MTTLHDQTVVYESPGFWVPVAATRENVSAEEMRFTFDNGTVWRQKIGFDVMVVEQDGRRYKVPLPAKGPWERIMDAAPDEPQPPAPQPVQTEMALCEVVPDSTLIPREVNGAVLWQRESDGYWNATAMATAVGKLLNDYIRLGRTKAFLEVLSSDTGIPVSGLLLVGKGGIPSQQGSWAHPRVAVNLAQWCSPVFEVKVSGWVHELLTRGKVELKPTAPQSYVEAVRELLHTLESNERLKLEKAEADTRAASFEEKATVQAQLAAREARAFPLTSWLNHTYYQHGHGPNVGTKMMRALGLLHRELVKGCRRTKESAIRQNLLQQGILLYSTSEFVKRKKRGNAVEPVLDREAKPVVGESRVILVDPDKGTDWLMNWFMTMPECALRRLVAHKYPGMHKLAHRYSFMESDTHAWDELTDEERRAGVNIREDNGYWYATTVKVPDAETPVFVHGHGQTIDAALLDLGTNM